jgi:hypothetical protein
MQLVHTPASRLKIDAERRMLAQTYQRRATELCMALPAMLLPTVVRWNANVSERYANLMEPPAEGRKQNGGAVVTKRWRRSHRLEQLAAAGGLNEFVVKRYSMTICVPC